jgi:RNase P subunit RPR2
MKKEEIKKEIDEFFKNIEEKNPKEIKKIKRLAMKHNLPLREKRKLFCKKCFSPYSGNEKIRIKNKIKIIKCTCCEGVSRWKV